MSANLADLLRERAERHGGRTALVEYRGGSAARIDFAGLARRVAGFSGGLERAGVGPGDRVLLFVPMSIDLYVALLGCLHAGAVAVFVDAWADRRRLNAAVAAARPKLFVGAPRAHLLRLLSPAVRGIPLHWTAGRRWARLARHEVFLSGGAAPPPPHPVSAGDPALITFTTGSTGAPKAAARSHGFLLAQHRALAEHLDLREGDVDMPTLPVFVLNDLALGVTSVIPDFDPRRPAEIDPERIGRQMAAEGVTTTSGSPAFYERLCGWAERRGEVLPLRRLWTGGAPVYPPLAARLAARIAGEAHIVYGSTEAEPIAGIEARAMLAAMAEEGEARDGGICCGPPVPGIRLRIIRARDEAVELGPDGWKEWELPPGETGEVVVAGPHVLGEYFEVPEETRLHKIRDGETVWHRTGDAARLDSAGRLRLMGRVGSRVEREGETWWPVPAEVRALRLPGVRHAAYLGEDEPALGQRAVLCVEGGPEAGVLEEEAREALAPIPVDRIVRLKRIPRDPRHASKTDIAALRRLLRKRRR